MQLSYKTTFVDNNNFLWYESRQALTLSNPYHLSTLDVIKAWSLPNQRSFCQVESLGCRNAELDICLLFAYSNATVCNIFSNNENTLAHYCVHDKQPLHNQQVHIIVIHLIDVVERMKSLSNLFIMFRKKNRENFLKKLCIFVNM